jgi:hypothetical protein
VLDPKLRDAYKQSMQLSKLKSLSASKGSRPPSAANGKSKFELNAYHSIRKEERKFEPVTQKTMDERLKFSNDSVEHMLLAKAEVRCTLPLRNFSD